MGYLFKRHDNSAAEGNACQSNKDKKQEIGFPIVQTCDYYESVILPA